MQPSEKGLGTATGLGLDFGLRLRPGLPPSPPELRSLHHHVALTCDHSLVRESVSNFLKLDVKCSHRTCGTLLGTEAMRFLLVKELALCRGDADSQQ